MNGLVGMTELLLTAALDDTPRRSTLMIRRSALSLRRPLHDIRDCSRIEAGEMAMVGNPIKFTPAGDVRCSPTAPTRAG